LRDNWIGADGNAFAIQYDPTHWVSMKVPK
jgi:hypothetical protein